MAPSLPDERGIPPSRRRSAAEEPSPAHEHTTAGTADSIDTYAEDRETPTSLENLDEIEAPQPVDPEEEQRPGLEQHLEEEKRRRQASSSDANTADESATPASIPKSITGGLDELAVGEGTAPPLPPPQHQHDGRAIEEKRSRIGRRRGGIFKQLREGESMRMLCTTSYLVFFALFGTLARLGLQALTIYPGAPVALGELWANVAGTAVMGFLAEDRALFARELEAAAAKAEEQRQRIARSADASNDGEGGASARRKKMGEFIRKEHVAVKKQIPLYLGLTVGFCGCFTTFSSFMRDAFLALSNDLNTDFVRTTAGPRSRDDGRSVEAVLAVLILEISACLAALDFGAHVAIALEKPLLRVPLPRNWTGALDAAVMVLAWPAWVGAVLLAIWPPHERWRAQAVFALVLGPAGCLVRFGLSLRLNALIPQFPLGTFVANVGGTLVLAAAWDLQHAGGVADKVGCQVLQGVQDGFCGCLTTVSTWMLELKGLRRRHAYVYGAGSVGVGLAVVVVVMGSLRWADGFEKARCSA